MSLMPSHPDANSVVGGAERFLQRRNRRSHHAAGPLGNDDQVVDMLQPAWQLPFLRPAIWRLRPSKLNGLGDDATVRAAALLGDSARNRCRSPLCPCRTHSGGNKRPDQRPQAPPAIRGAILRRLLARLTRVATGLQSPRSISGPTAPVPGNARLQQRLGASVFENPVATPFEIGGDHPG